MGAEEDFTSAAAFDAGFGRVWEGRQSQFQARTDPKVSGTATGYHQTVSELSIRSER